MGWLIALAILIVILIIPLGIQASYNHEGFFIKLIAGFIRFTVNLNGKKQKSPSKNRHKEKKSDSKSKKKPKENTSPQQPNRGGSILDFLPLVRVGLDLLDCLRRKLRVDVLEVRVVMTSGDPATLGINYGRACAALGNLLPRLERILIIKKREIDIACDFTGGDTLVTARLDLTITIGRLLGIATVYGFRGLKTFLQIKKKRKGGANNE